MITLYIYPTIFIKVGFWTFIKVRVYGLRFQNSSPKVLERKLFKYPNLHGRWSPHYALMMKSVLH